MSSNELNLVVERAYQAMIKHPEHDLLPIWRHEIYRLLSIDINTDGERIRKRLSVITARYVMPIWDDAKLNNPLLERLINLAEGIMNNTVPVDLAQDEADRAWEYLERLGGERREMALGNAFYAGQAALEALQEALGRYPFGKVIIEKDMTDLDLDPWCSDTAHWTVIAYSGFTNNPATEIEKRQLFWEWWLKEAIPSALNFSKI